MLEAIHSATRAPEPKLSPLSSFHRRRPLFWFALSVCVGIFADNYFSPQLNCECIGFAVLLTFGAVMAFVVWRRAGFALGCVCAMAAGSLYHAAGFRVAPPDDIALLTPERTCVAWVRGVIIEAEWKDDADAKTTHWIVAVNSLGTDRASLSPSRGRIRISANLSPDDGTSERLTEGDEIECSLKIEPIPPATLPEGFDYGAYLRSRGVSRLGLVSRSKVAFIHGPVWYQIHLVLRRWSGAIALSTQEMLGGNAEQAGLLNAMLFGRREALSVADRESFSINGTAHLLAISGLHVALICAAFYRLLGIFGLPRRRAALWVLVASLMYCLLTGSSPPAIRSVAMLAAYVVAVIFWREADPLNALASGALICLAIAPHDLFSAGFQLSFLAVLSLITLLPTFEDAWEQWALIRARNMKLSLPPVPNASDEIDSSGALIEPWLDSWSAWLWKGVRSSFFISLAAWLATSPAVAWHMGRISTLSLLANLVVVPLLSCCMFPGIAALVLGTVWPTLGKVAGFVASLFLTWLERANAYFAGVPWASIDSPRPPVALLLLIMVLLASLWIMRERYGALKRLAVLLPLAILSIFASTCFFRKPSGMELTVFDAGRGHSALVAGPDGSRGAMLINTGEAIFGNRLAECLRRSGLPRLELLVITSDDPKAMGGAQDLLRMIPAKRVVLPRAKMPSEMRRGLERWLSERKIAYFSPRDGETLSAPGGVELLFLNDGPADDQPPANSSTLSVRIKSAEFSAFVIEAKSSASLERLLAKRGIDFRADVVRMIPGTQQRWPRECAEIVRRSCAQVLVAGTGSGAEELPGWEFDTPSHSPKREGSLRISAEKKGEGSGARLKIEAFKNVWRELQAGTNSD